MRRKVLIVTYYFPPRPEIASVRLGGLANYLSDYGWEPVVLTVALPFGNGPKVRVIETDYHDIAKAWKTKFGYADIGDIVMQCSNQDAGEKHVKKWNKIKYKAVRWGVDKIKEVINYPDSLYGWYPYAIKTVEDVLQKERFDAVISSSPPVTSHLIAQYLCEKHEIPWVADFRDLWTQDHYRSYSMFRNIIERRLEKSTMKKAGALVTVSEPLVEKLKSLHGNEDVFSVPNGFDPMLWRDNIDNLTEKFSITYTGTIYEGKRDPTPLFEALVQLINSQRVARERIEVRFYGPQDMGNWLRVRVAKLKLEDIVKYYGVVSRQEALLRQRESQMLLLLNWNDPEEKGVYTGKVFEYLCAQRPILALGSVGGVVQELLAETKAGISVSSQSELEEVVLAGYQEYFASGRTTYSGCKKEIMKYSHREMALKFSRILDMVSSAPAKLLNIT